MARAGTRLLALMLVSAVVAGAGNAAFAAPILDQSFLAGESSVSGNDPFAQTFTVGRAGRLTSVDVRIFGGADVTVDIRPTILGVPLLSDDLADQLSRVIVTPSDVFSLVSVDLRPFKIAVQPGDVLAIVLRSQGVQNWGLALDAIATYSGGEAFLWEGAGWQTFDHVFPMYSRADFQFQTFVPEPATVSLLGIGVACLFARRTHANAGRRLRKRGSSSTGRPEGDPARRAGE